jgi:hypothetical protein
MHNEPDKSFLLVPLEYGSIGRIVSSLIDMHHHLPIRKEQSIEAKANMHRSEVAQKIKAVRCSFPIITKETIRNYLVIHFIVSPIFRDSPIEFPWMVKFPNDATEPVESITVTLYPAHDFVFPIKITGDFIFERIESPS